MKTKVVAYVRKSTEETIDIHTGEKSSRRQQNSEISQNNVISTLEEKHDIKVAERFYDDVSGYEAFKRDDFKEMLKYLAENEDVTGIVCRDISRLARNFGDGGYILWYLQDGVIDKIYTHDKIFTNSASDQLMVAINFALAKHQSDETGRKAQEGQRTRIQRNNHPPKGPIYGYKSLGIKGDKKWGIHRKNAAKVRELFEEFAKGEMTREQVYEYAVKTLDIINPKRKKPYAFNTIINWLSNKEYMGIFSWEEKEYVGDYTPIIDKELFYKVRKVLLRKSFKKSGDKWDYAFTGIVKCHYCGNGLSGTVKKGHVYYRCSKRDPTKECASIKRLGYLRESDLHSYISENLSSINFNKQRWRKLGGFFNVIHKEESKELDIKLNLKRDEVNILQTKINNTNESFINKEISKEHSNSLIESYESDIDLLDEDIQRMSKRMDKIKVLQDLFLKQLIIITEAFDFANAEHRRTMLQTYCENLTWDGRKAYWTWAKPFLYLAKLEGNSDWLRVLESARTQIIISLLSDIKEGKVLKYLNTIFFSKPLLKGGTDQFDTPVLGSM